VRFKFIDEHQKEFEVSVMCRVLEVSRSGYYEWRNRRASQRKIANDKLAEEIKRVYEKNRRAYGQVRVWKALNKAGIACGRDRVGRLMRENGLRGKRLKRFIRTTLADSSKTPAPNLLNRQFAAQKPNLKLVGDITYIPTGQGWLYLAVVIDLFSRRVVGWAMADHMRSELVCTAFEMALRQRQPAVGMLFHSDRGSQYTSDDFRKLLADNGVTASMSRKGNCWDNAVAESFFASLKTELADSASYATRQDAETDIFFYIEGFYNRTRLHSYLDYCSPAEFETNFEQQQTQILTISYVH
jgi:transposase InsO family protein